MSQQHTNMRPTLNNNSNHDDYTKLYKMFSIIFAVASFVLILTIFRIQTGNDRLIESISIEKNQLQSEVDSLKQLEIKP